MRAQRKAAALRRGAARIAFGLVACALASPAAAEDGVAPGELLVRFRAEGPHALRACAEDLARRGVSFQSASAARSDSLDQLRHRLGVRAVRALFRRADGRPLGEQRERLRARLASARADRAAAPGRAARQLPDLSHVYRLRISKGADVHRAAALLRADPHVIWAQPNFVAEADFVPDDPFFASSGSWGQSFRDLWGLERIGAPAAWDRSQGEGVVVAVIDTGLDYEHPDVAANVWVHPGEDLNGNGRVDPSDFNGLDDDGNGFVDDVRGFDFINSVDADGDGFYDGPDDVSDSDPFDDNGHGTHVAGTVAAVGNNGIGVLGVAPRARIMPLKGFGQGIPATIELLSRAMLYAVENGARVINNSWSCSARCPDNPVAEEVVELANALGVVVVTSAGNKVDDVVFFSPENKRGTIVVAASTELDRPAYFTNFGMLVDVIAPGAGEPTGSVRLPNRGILSLRSSGIVPANEAFGEAVLDEEYLRWAGTSMSSPHVAGVAALLLAQRPELTSDEVRALIRTGADDIGTPGHDRTNGAGVANAAGALALPSPSVRAEIASPRPGAVISQLVGEIVLEGSAAGSGFERYELSIGAGAEPTSWQVLPAASAGAVEDGVLAAWPIAELGDGAYVARLEVVARDGMVLTEVLPLSLERNVPTRVSSEGAAARAPAISGKRVVWQSARPLSEDPEEAKAEKQNLFVTDLARGVEGVVAADPGRQHSAAIEGNRVVWLDESSEDGQLLFHCVLDSARQPCRAAPLAPEPGLRSAPRLSGDRVVWAELEGRSQLRICELNGPHARCPDGAAVPGAGRQVEPYLDGDRLFWSGSGSGSFRLEFCDLGRDGCAPSPVGSQNGAMVTVASGDLVAWWRPGSSSLIFACVLDAETGACPMELIALAGGAPDLAISGNRLVWNAPGSGGGDNLYFCERDRVTGACPVQQLTGSAGDERNADIDGARVVWQDDRNGLLAILSFELPQLQPQRDRVVSEGESLVVRVVGWESGGAPLALEAAQADGSPLESLGATFTDRGDGSGVLRWQPGFDRAGSYAVTFTGTSVGRLKTRQTIRIEVRDVDAVPSSARSSRSGS
jgi:subtilisin family serine protease